MAGLPELIADCLGLPPAHYCQQSNMFSRMSSNVWQTLLPRPSRHPELDIPPQKATLIAGCIHYLVEQLVSVEVKARSLLTKVTVGDVVDATHLRIITPKVLNLVWEACEADRSCVVFALLICRKHFHSTMG